MIQDTIIPKKRDTWTLLDILALSFVKGMSSVAIRAAVDRTYSLEDCFSYPPTTTLQRLLSKDLFDDNIITSLRAQAAEQLELCAANNIRIITLWDEDYPVLLRNINYPPAMLFVQGTLQHHDSIAIAIIGTRRCSQYGKYITEKFAESFTNAGVVVVSGLANGVDMAAHQQTTKLRGKTYAVIASGIDCISPYHAKKQAEQIVAHGGAIISEYRCGIKAMPAYFPQRNRIISGISRAIVVIESGTKGGSLITAQFAIDQERELYAVPGNINSEKSEGTNKLIQAQLAIPALSPEQVLYDLGIQHSTPQLAIPEFSSPTEERIYAALSIEQLQADELADKLNININELLVSLLTLEFRGLIRQLPGKIFTKS
ncbi:MAG: DNA-protecting protein DprA [Candidatus Kapabacteria bacterium]|nr:DNA-protecting protein DprA [Candidatus Kapabacteria bacterium]